MGFWAPPRIPDETASSFFMRTADFYGMSPRAFARALFGTNQVFHPQHPKFLPAFAAQLEGSPDPSELICRHSTFLLIAPFLEWESRTKLWMWLKDGKGCWPNPRTKQALFLKYRYCPHCFKEQLEACGERAWLRSWQIPANTICPKHRTPLWELPEPFRDRFGVTRNLNPNEADLSAGKPLAALPHAELIADAVYDLLNARSVWTPADDAEPERMTALEDWLEYYDKRRLAAAARNMRAYWGDAWLDAMGITSIKLLLTPAWKRSWLTYLVLLKSIHPDASLVDWAWGKRTNISPLNTNFIP